jgi:hypothetical protein
VKPDEFGVENVVNAAIAASFGGHGELDGLGLQRNAEGGTEAADVATGGAFARKQPSLHSLGNRCSTTTGISGEASADRY